MTEQERFQAIYDGIAAIMHDVAAIIGRLDGLEDRLDISNTIRRQQYHELLKEIGSRASGVHSDLERVYRRLETLETLIHTHNGDATPNGP